MRAALAALATVAIAACGATSTRAPAAPSKRARLDLSGPLGVMRGECLRGDGLMCETLGETQRGEHNSAAQEIALDRDMLRMLCDRFTIAGACVGLGWLLPDAAAPESVALFTR